jgi:hypothetical protein
MSLVWQQSKSMNLYLYIGPDPVKMPFEAPGTYNRVSQKANPHRSTGEDLDVDIY